MTEAFSLPLTLAITGLTAFQTLIGILGFLVAFGLAVFIHELGHFLAAKAFKVPVERFVIGFDKEAMGFLPRCIWEKKIGETVYGLSLIPLGGYVKMSGVVHPDIEKYLDGNEGAEPAPAMTESIRADGVAAAPDKTSLEGQVLQDMAALYRKPFWQKAIIYSAGVIMNLILAMVMVTILYTRGFEVDAPLPAEIAWIPAESPYAKSGLTMGDLVLAVNGEAVADSDKMLDKLGEILTKEGATDSPAPIMFKIQRAGSTETYDFPLTAAQIREASFTDTFLRRPAYIEALIPNDPADKAGMRSGDMVTSIDGVAVADWTQFRTLVRAAPGKDVKVGLVRDGKPLEVTLVPTENPDEPGKGLIGAFPGNPKKELLREPFGTALWNSPGRVWIKTQGYVRGLMNLGSKVTKGNVGAVRREVGGPVGIAQMAYRQAQAGFSSWVNFVILLNVALAVMNILPFPVLDGGHICFALYEAAFGKPVPPKVLVPILNGAVAIIIGFFLLVTFNDLFKIFS